MEYQNKQSASSVNFQEWRPPHPGLFLTNICKNYKNLTVANVGNYRKLVFDSKNSSTK